MGFTYREAGSAGFHAVSGWDGATGVFTTRKGGVSPAPFDSLNLGAGSGDDPGNVTRNRRILEGALGINGGIKTVSQVHGSDVYVMTDPDDTRPIEGYDAVITNIAGAAVGVLTADCVPILLYDPIARAVAAVHAGWAGTVKNIAAHAVERMSREYGTQPSDVLAAVGPSIGPCCYEVDEKVIGPLRESIGGWGTLTSPTGPGHWRLDLWETNRRVLAGAGVLPDNISVLGLCTACNPEQFFSHRQSGGRAGRMMGVVRLD